MPGKFTGPTMNKKDLRVCFFLETLNFGGVQRVILNLADEFVKKEIDVDLFVSSLTGPYMSRITHQVRVFPGSNRVRNILPFFRYLQSQKPDVLITSHIHISIMSIILCKLVRIPITIVVTVHVHCTRANQSNNFFRALIVRMLARISYPLADSVVAVSESVANDLSRFIDFPQDRIDVINNAAVTQRVFAEANERLSHPWFETNTIPIILGSGRLTEQKDFHTLIRAFAIVRASINAKLMILGEGEERSSLEDLIYQLNLKEDIELRGYVENPFSYMARASLFVLSSLWEGSPTVLIEALALGIPVVATDCPGGSKEILENGKYGTLVPVGNSERIAKAILEVLHKKTDKAMIKRRGMEYSAQRSAEQYLQLLYDSFRV